MVHVQGLNISRSGVPEYDTQGLKWGDGWLCTFFFIVFFTTMKAIRATLENFDAVLKNGLESHNPVYVVFFGTEKPETNESWCPDCVVADPLIRKAILTHAPENALLLEAPVGHREDWKGNASHPYRTRFNLSAIPTLFRWTKV